MFRTLEKWDFWTRKLSEGVKESGFPSECLLWVKGECCPFWYVPWKRVRFRALPFRSSYRGSETSASSLTMTAVFFMG